MKTIPLSELLAKLPVPSSAVMWQNLRQSPCDPRCGEHWEVPLHPAGNGNCHAVVYSSHRNDEGAKADCIQRAALLAHAANHIGPLVEALEQAEAAITNAIAWSGGRETEWGQRAMDAFRFLEHYAENVGGKALAAAKNVEVSHD